MDACVISYCKACQIQILSNNTNFGIRETFTALSNDVKKKDEFKTSSFDGFSIRGSQN